MGCNELLKSKCLICQEEFVYSRHLSKAPKTCGKLVCMIATGEMAPVR